MFAFTTITPEHPVITFVFRRVRFVLQMFEDQNVVPHYSRKRDSALLLMICPCMHIYIVCNVLYLASLIEYYY